MSRLRFGSLDSWGSSHHLFPAHDRSSSEALSTPGGADSRQAGQKAFVSNCSSQEVRWLGGLVRGWVPGFGRSGGEVISNGDIVMVRVDCGWIFFLRYTYIVVFGVGKKTTPNQMDLPEGVGVCIFLFWVR